MTDDKPQKPFWVEIKFQEEKEVFLYEFDTKAELDAFLWGLDEGMKYLDQYELINICSTEREEA